MKIEQIPIESLSPAEYNPRAIDKEEMANLKRAVREWGMIQPLVVNRDGTIIGGHQRYRVMLELGHKTAPCVVLDVDKVKERQINLALNKISGKFDKDKLRDVLTFLDINGADLRLSGFSHDAPELQSLESPPEVVEWDVTAAYDPCWIVVRAPVECYPIILDRLKGIEDERVVVEGSL